MGKKSGPPAPDYTAAAQAQGAASQANTTQQTWANRPDQTSPFGNISWGATTAVDPATGQKVTRWTQNTTLDPTLQSALDSQIATQQGRSDLANSLLPSVQQSMGTPMNWNQFSQLAGTPGATSTQAGPLQSSLNFSGAQQVGDAASTRQKAEDALYSAATSRLDPQFQQQQADLETQLANQGISRNSAAYTRAMDDFNRSKTDAYAQARNAAISGGGAEAQRDYSMDLGLRQQQVSEALQQGNFGNAAAQQGFAQQLAANNQNFAQGLQSANYQNQLRQQQIAEALQQRNQPLNDLNALLSGQQVSNPQFQNFGQAGVAQTPDLLGAANAQYQAGLNAQGNSNAMFGNLLGAAGTAAGAFFGFSDVRVKRDAKRLRRDPRGFWVYSFRYIGERGRRVGVMAQEVRRVMPQAVRSIGGVLAVDYGALGMRLEQSAT